MENKNITWVKNSLFIFWKRLVCNIEDSTDNLKIKKTNENKTKLNKK